MHKSPADAEAAPACAGAPLSHDEGAPPIKTTLAEPTPLALRLEIETAWELVEPDYDDATQHYRDAPVPGYRPGRAPLGRIAQYYQREICAAAARTAAARLTRDTLRRDAIRTAGAITITHAQLTPGRPFRCTAELTRRPDLALPDYTRLPPHIASADPETLRDRISDWLVAQTPFDIPRTLVAEQLDPAAPPGETGDQWHEAGQRARLLVITREIADREGIDVPPRELSARIDALARDTGATPKDLRRRLETTGGLDSYRAFLLAETVLDYIARSARADGARHP